MYTTINKDSTIYHVTTCQHELPSTSSCTLFQVCLVNVVQTVSMFEAPIVQKMESMAVHFDEKSEHMHPSDGANKNNLN